MEANKALNPEQIGFLCLIRQAPQAYKASNFVIRARSQNSENHMRNEGNYLIGLRRWKRMGGIIRPWSEQEWLRRGRITPAVAVVIGAQDFVFIKKLVFF
ncbi:hypothetical protein [uncultured Marinobacter sp.]|uniref:hypothetical protein n=1 Tax=uncultured Marinobacter sp. TaxID=187379 RepID=UPI0025DE12AE|nr:hypothetical protein [uncultured Marinobacter sp.]